MLSSSKPNDLSLKDNKHVQLFLIKNKCTTSDIILSIIISVHPQLKTIQNYSQNSGINIPDFIHRATKIHYRNLLQDKAKLLIERKTGRLLN